MGVSPGKIGTAIAQGHLRQVMLYLDTNVIGQPELYFGPAQGMFDEAGNITDASTQELLTKALNTLKNRKA